MKKLLVLSLLLFFGYNLSATHLMGGEITWQCAKSGANAGKVKFRVILYRECRTSSGGSVSFPGLISITSNSPAGSISAPRITINNVSPTCYSGQLSCATGVGGEGRMEEHIYESAWINLNGTPPAAGWEFSWTSCCRPGSISNGGSNQGYWLRAKIYPYTPPGGTTALNMNTCYDSSPQFAEKPKSIICTGYPYTFSQNAYEPEFDSVHYAFANPLGTGAGIVPYSSPYSVANPFPNQGNPVGFTPSTGLITVNPNTGGSFMSCIKVESYRCGQKISEIFRDVAMVIKTGCELTGTASVNLPPILTVDSIPGSSGQIIVPVKQYSGYGTDTVYYAQVYPGDTIQFRLTGTDNQLTPTFGLQNVSFSANSAQIHNSTIAGTCAEPPCAFVTPVSPATSFTNPLSLNVDFSWEIACNHISSQNSCGTGANSYYFPLKMQDDACPAPANGIRTIKIDVLQRPIQQQPLSSTFTAPGNGYFKLIYANTFANFQWQENKGSSWYDLNDTGIYSGTMTDSLVLTGITRSMNGYLYRCTIDSSCLMSSAAILSVICLDTISKQPLSSTFYTSPGDAHFTTSHSDTSATFQWQVKTTPGTTGTWSDIVNGAVYYGANADSIGITGITANMNGYEYRCQIDAYCDDTSNSATLSVIDNVSLEEFQSSITVYPNPNEGFFSLILKESFLGSSFHIVDDSGRIIKKGTIREKKQLFDLSDNPKGIYRIQILFEKKIETITLVLI